MRTAGPLGSCLALRITAGVSPGLHFPPALKALGVYIFSAFRAWLARIGWRQCIRSTRSACCLRRYFAVLSYLIFPTTSGGPVLVRPLFVCFLWRGLSLLAFGAFLYAGATLLVRVPFTPVFSRNSTRSSGNSVVSRPAALSAQSYFCSCFRCLYSCSCGYPGFACTLGCSRFSSAWTWVITHLTSVSTLYTFSSSGCFTSLASIAHKCCSSFGLLTLLFLRGSV